MILTNIERQRARVLRPQISLLPLPGLAWPVGEIARGGQWRGGTGAGQANAHIICDRHAAISPQGGCAAFRDDHVADDRA
jgi:hypothetical protein